MTIIDEYQDVMDIRDIIDRIEEIEGEQNALVASYTDERDKDDTSERFHNAINALSNFWGCAPEEVADSVAALSNPADTFNGDEEAAAMRAFIEQFRGYGGDHEWENSWFPVTFIRDSYFEDYAEELAEEIGAIPKESAWPTSHIDWKAAARALQWDYTSGEYNDVTYWARS